MFEIKYPHLFSPVRIGDVTFRNRIFASPTGYQDITARGHLTPEGFAYYERKAAGGAASVCVGECVVDSEYGAGAEYHILMDDPLAMHSLNRLTDAVTKHGAVASAELQHWGMQANIRNDKPAYGPSEGMAHGKQVTPLSEEMIEGIIAKFASAASFAKRCGFGMITLHGAHGWLIAQFLSSKTNFRKDKWGGGVENRARFAIAIADAIHKECGPRFPVEIRLSGDECYAEGYDLGEGLAIAQQLDGHFDLLHISAGAHEVPEVFTIMTPSMFLEDGCNVRFAAEVKKRVKTPVAAVGALSDPALMEEIIASGKADIVEVARGLIADPDLPNKAREGRGAEIRTCMRCMTCFSSLLSKGQFFCSINPKAGRDLECKYTLPPAEKKRVLVAGGGIAGMQAAITCASRGHEVVLCEKTDRLGGAILCEETVPFKKNLAKYIEFQRRRVETLPIDLRMNTAVTARYAGELAPDVIIAALGARAVRPDIPGIGGTNVYSAEEIYSSPGLAGESVVILGAGLVGTELGIYLAGLNKKVRILEAAPGISDGGNFLHVLGVNVQIDRLGIELHFNTKAVSILDGAVTGETETGTATFPADTVVYAVGRAPLGEEADALRSLAPRFYQIGDCTAPGTIARATSAAYAIANDVGRF
ncbi:MAG: NAD(P)/FAD-dependent oxidoreductase [Oscillospiraceae bacterium]|jgi:2,4-dienoyl-CoA reductase-like NADH-dependent reductase (Old Yellow Enzyme family)/thioredoxin reductase|nr:NAD(P)/FAD-dependent oxidoreductase [Oscillospiraceae bacterium]